MNRQPLLQCRDLAIRIGGAIILKDVNFKLEKGDHLVIQGLSGSGKSTLLKALLGFLPVEEGVITFNGQSMRGGVFKKLRSHAAWLPQDLNLGSDTALQVMERPFSFQRNELQKPDRQAIVAIITRLGLEEGDLQKPYAHLSTGQRQRVGIAICILLKKPVLLLDEPTSALDNASKEKAAEVLLTEHKTVISTSHDHFWTQKASKVIEIT